MQTPWPDDLGRFARQRRLDLELSQDDLAERAGVTRQWLTKFELAKSDVSLSKALRVIRELDLSVDVAPKVELNVTRHSNQPFIDDAVLTAMAENIRRAHGRSGLSASARAALDKLSTDPALRESMRKLESSNRENLATINLPTTPVFKVDE